MVRQLQKLFSWISRRSRLTKLILLTSFVTSPCWIGCGGWWLYGWFNYWVRYTEEDREFIRQGRYGFEGGLPSVGRKLKAEMESIPDPGTAMQLHPDWTYMRFGNGEWVFGHGIDSHWIGFGRGTLVVKDSRGRVRVLFGHVCGTNHAITPYDAAHLSTLNVFYEQLLSFSSLREWFPD
jgi:hypothetical protein